jgi:uncharacterized protein YhfF
MSSEITILNGMEAFRFGDSPAMANELGALVVSGAKTATCWAATQGQLTEVGRQMVVLDGEGRGMAIVETIELSQRRFDDVEWDFARDEGEGDLTLDDWRAGHRRYFTREGTFAPDMMLWCERFRLVRVLDREAAR